MDRDVDKSAVLVQPEAATVDQADVLAGVFRVLSDPTRVKILLLLLTTGERNVMSMCDALRLPQPTVSHHLGLLRTGKVVCCRRAGKQILYQLAGKAAVTASGDLAIEVSGLSIKITDASAAAGTPRTSPWAHAEALQTHGRYVFGQVFS